MSNILISLSPAIKTWQEGDKWRVKVVHPNRKLNYTLLRKVDTEAEAIEIAEMFISLYFKS